VIYVLMKVAAIHKILTWERNNQKSYFIKNIDFVSFVLCYFDIKIQIHRI